MGSVTKIIFLGNGNRKISTHTLRGERDVVLNADDSKSVISTHTLRGERDLFRFFLQDDGDDFNSHAPWGA